MGTDKKAAPRYAKPEPTFYRHYPLGDPESIYRPSLSIRQADKKFYATIRSDGIDDDSMIVAVSGATLVEAENKAREEFRDFLGALVRFGKTIGVEIEDEP